jgi:hypothetical protein
VSCALLGDGVRLALIDGLAHGAQILETRSLFEEQTGPWACRQHRRLKRSKGWFSPQRFPPTVIEKLKQI